ncbi:DUF5020 family protein [Puia sp. P3]|uniref:DUF5020 family protein n=1 Tax=Puia sp. P3 TaxID=3423952 RepID=UPI003D668F41
MQRLLLILIASASLMTQAQNLQLHYDFRHTVSPAQNPRNFTTLYFEYWKKQDSGRSVVKPRSFLFKTEADFYGAGNNIGKFFLQVSQSLRFWKPKIYLALQYSGGAGITEPKQYSYYISNTFSAGLEYPFQWKGVWLTSQLYLRYTPSSVDPLFTLYWWKGFLHYRLEIAGDFSIWTQNTNGRKRIYFFAEPQLWYKLLEQLSLGTKLTLYRPSDTNGPLQIAPTIAARWRL